MFAGLNNSWIIISVILPGAIFYVTFLAVFSVINVTAPEFMTSDNQIIAGAIIVACGLVLQLFGMMSEALGFRIWNHIAFRSITKDSGMKCPSVFFPLLTNQRYGKQFWTHRYWRKRYKVLSKMSTKDSTIE